MKALGTRVPKALPHYARIVACDNSGARILKIISVKQSKTVKSRKPAAGVGDLIMASVVEGKPEMRKQVVMAVVVRQKKAIRRLDGLRVKFEDNAAVVIKDKFGNPKGTMIKGPIAKEAADRWPLIGKVANTII
ncbi:50S ribosomal protein L14 [Candidatus Woesearchaeota archaeon]|nr:MAG: 50S ribosomal protein L14 [Candidatus Woesearchaeota archaeon]